MLCLCVYSTSAPTRREVAAPSGVLFGDPTLNIIDDLQQFWTHVTETERSGWQQEGEIGIVRPLGFGGVSLRGRGGVQRYHPHPLPSWLKH
jgi:hypothetical protein